MPKTTLLLFIILYILLRWLLSFHYRLFPFLLLYLPVTVNNATSNSSCFMFDFSCYARFIFSTLCFSLITDTSIVLFYLCPIPSPFPVHICFDLWFLVLTNIFKYVFFCCPHNTSLALILDGSFCLIWIYSLQL